jgi:hypothetical protein
MKRLREEAAADPTRARGARLLRSGIPSARRHSSPEMKRRVWDKLVAARRAGGSVRTTRPLVVRRRSAVLALCVLLSTATAGAVIGRGAISRRFMSLVSRNDAARVAQPGARPRAHRAPAVIDDVSVPPEKAPPTNVAVPLEPPHHVSGHAVHAADHSALDRSVSRSVVDEEAAHQLLVDAMLALRRARDFQRAGDLLERYLTKYPRGALREEAIALAVEAAAARTDFARRDHWASVYLKDYPAGRFRAFVEASRADGN